MIAQVPRSHPLPTPNRGRLSCITSNAVIEWQQKEVPCEKFESMVEYAKHRY